MKEAKERTEIFVLCTESDDLSGDSHQTSEMNEPVMHHTILTVRSESFGVVPGDTADVHTYSPSELDTSATYLPVFGNAGGIKDQNTSEFPESLLTLCIPSKDVIFHREEKKELPLSNPLMLRFDGCNGEFNAMDLGEAAFLDCTAIQSKKFSLNGSQEVTTVEPSSLCFRDHESTVEAVELDFKTESNASSSVKSDQLELEMFQWSEACKSSGPIDGNHLTNEAKQMLAMPSETSEFNCNSEDSVLTPLKLTNSKRESSGSGDSTLELEKNAELAVHDYPSGECIILSADKGTVNCTSEMHLETENTLELSLDHQEAVLEDRDCTCSCRSNTSSEDRSDSEITEFLQNLREGNRLKEFQHTSRFASEEACGGVSSRSSNLPTCIKNESGLDSSQNHSPLKGGNDSQSVSPQRLSTVASSIVMGKNSRVITGRKRYNNDISSFSQKLFDGTQTAECALATLCLPSPYSGQVSFSGPVSSSGPLAYSGQIPYSGNISLRSDSSTTSAHSFAFPILASEWNSSPVKMPQPDQRYLQRRWWRWCFCYLCCYCCKRPSTLFD